MVTTTPPTAVTVTSLETELAGLFAGISVMLEDCYLEGSGRRMLALTDEGPETLSIESVRVRATRIGQMLPVWHAYAYEGVVLAGFDSNRFDNGDGALERLGDLLSLLRPANGYFEDCLMTAGVDDPAQAQGHLAELLARVHARLALDAGGSLSLTELALLADMNERSVRNALSGEGDSRLQAHEDGAIAHEEAVRWLNGRRNFKPTQRRGFGKDLTKVPDTLLAAEIPGFVESRLARVAKTWPPYQDKAYGQYSAADMEAARRSGMPAERIFAVQALPLSIEPADCTALARLLEVDPAWFTYQVMTALFPEQVDMLLNPSFWAASPDVASEDQPAAQSVVVELTVAMLKNGYLDIPMAAKDLFPNADLGSKGTGFEGTPVELVFGTHRETTDIRMKSTKTLAPRKRFNGWFNTELRAKPGDRIRIDKTGDAVFTLTYVPT